jgi:hypothetical protein
MLRRYIWSARRIPFYSIGYSIDFGPYHQLCIWSRGPPFKRPMTP